MTARVSGLMARLKVAERLDDGKGSDSRGRQDYGKVAGFCQPLKKAEIGERLLKNVEVASPVTTLVTTPAANDPDRRATAVALSSCGQCAMRRAPGAARPGYCIGRDDLQLAYGLLHVLPCDLGDGCPEYRPRGGPDKT